MEWLKMSQIAVGNYTYPLYSFEYFLESMKRINVDNIEIWAAGPHLYLYDFTFSMLNNMKRQIVSRNIKPICFTPEQCVYPINIGAKEDYIRERSVEYFVKAIEAAEVLEVPSVIVTPGDGYRNENALDTWKYTVENLRLLSEKAKEKGICLFLEHLTNETTNIATKAKELQLLKEATEAENIICMIDTDMMSRYDESVEDYMKETNGNIGHVHFVDGMPSGHLALGDGVLPMEKYLSALDRANYKGYLSLEITNDRYYLNPEEAVKRSLIWLKKHLE